MRRDKEQARHLRLCGKSYNEIHEILKVPRSTLSTWFAKEDWSTEIRTELTKSAQASSKVRILELNKVRGEHLIQVYEQARLEASEEFEFLKRDPLFIAGLMLYWGEGDKVGKQFVRLSNTEPEMIRLFVLFLLKTCNIDPQKIHFNLLIYPDLNEPEVKKQWSSAVGLPEQNFIKSTPIKGRHPTKRLGAGVCIAYVSSTYLKVKMLEWIKLLPRELMKLNDCENILVCASRSIDADIV